MELSLISCDEMASILVRATNISFGTPVADHDGSGSSFTVAAPATGQLFTITVADATTRQESRNG